MSVDATRWAWSQTGLRPSHKLVLLSICDRAGEQMRCFPSLARLSSDTCLNLKTIKTAIKDLSSRSLIEISGGHGNVNIYTLVGVPLREAGPGPKTDQALKRTRPKSGRRPGPKTDHDLALNRATNLPRTIIEPTNISPQGVDPVAWGEFNSHRIALGGKSKKGWTELAKKKAASKLRQYTPAQQREMVDNSIEGSWTGLFPPKANGKSPTQPPNSEPRCLRIDKTTGRKYDPSIGIGGVRHPDDPYA